MSFTNFPLDQNVAGGLGGRADGQLARDSLRNQVQPSKDIMVSRTSGGTFLTLRDPQGSSTETTTGGGTTGGGSSTTVTNTLAVTFGSTSGSMMKYVYDENDDKVYFCGVASVNSVGGFTNVKWISPPIAATANVANSTQSGSVFSGTTSQYQFGLWPNVKGAFMASDLNWQLDAEYDVTAGEELWLVKLSEPVEVAVNTHLPPVGNLGQPAGNVYGFERFSADYVDMNPSNRKWAHTP